MITAATRDREQPAPNACDHDHGHQDGGGDLGDNPQQAAAD